MQRTPFYAVPDECPSGIRTLWLKVVVRAVFDWVLYRDSRKLAQAKLAESAGRWLFEPSHLVNGFENVCLMLDLDARQVRAAALRMTKESVTSVEGLEQHFESLTCEETPRLEAGT